MLFNSYEFLFLFLPVTIAVFLLLGRQSRALALGWLILASVVFYIWWRPINLAIIAPSLLVNFVIGRMLLPLAGDEAQKGKRRLILTLGVLFNLGMLGWFKYANFAVNMANDVAGTDLVLHQIILPLGISFITFQKIAFLLDIAGGRIKTFTLRDFLLFVMFFPQLIAGPIVHYREMMPQFRDAQRLDGGTVATALTLLVFGLFKKVVLADGIARHVAPIYAYAAAGGEPTLIDGWLAAVGFTLQIYFDFSGYSDMACGAALFFGIRLPMNFDSPLKATNIVDFWRRWHVTLTRFLTSYVYMPLLLSLSKKRQASGKPPLRARNSALIAFLQVIALPTILTMFLSGIWHGAGYTFLIWGVIHGVYLVTNHAWRHYKPLPKPGVAPSKLGPILGTAGTFLAVAIAMVFFRAIDLPSALTILKGMVGLNGVSLTNELAGLIGLNLPPAMNSLGEVSTSDYVESLLYVAVLLAIAMLMPNTLQMLSERKPVLDGPTTPPRVAGVGPAVYWRPTALWLAFMSVLAAASVLQLAGESEFLYWQF